MVNRFTPDTFMSHFSVFFIIYPHSHYNFVYENNFAYAKIYKNLLQQVIREQICSFNSYRRNNLNYYKV